MPEDVLAQFKMNPEKYRDKFFETVLENPTKNPAWLKGGKTLNEVDLEVKFQEMTGLKPTEKIIDLTINAPTEEQVLFTLERRAEEKPIVSPEQRKYTKARES